jgi:hypothetical protein
LAERILRATVEIRRVTAEDNIENKQTCTMERKPGISEKRNEILAGHFFGRKPRKSLLGTMPSADLSDLRGHAERW